MKITKPALSAFALGFGLLASTASVTAMAQNFEEPQLSRQEVQQDLKAWRDAGFSEHAYLALSYDTFGDPYKNRMTTYRQLSQSNAE